MYHLTTVWAVLYILPILSGCGAVGPPIPPEDVGIEAKIRAQQSRQADSQAAETAVPLEEEPITLPPLRPVGER